jgi:hypothetical protein
MTNIPNYICAIDGMMFGRYSNAKRHNLNIHRNTGTIVGTTEYLVGVSTGKYRPPVDSLAMSRNRRHGGAKRMPNFGYIIPGSPPEPLLNRVARDSMGDITTNNFRPGVPQGQAPYNSYLQQARAEPRQYHIPSHSPTNQNHNQNTPAYHTPTTAALPPSDPTLMMSQSQHSQPTKHWGTLPQDFIQKIVELKRLLYRYPTTFPNPEIIIQGAKHFCLQGDPSFLDEKLEYLRNVDAITGQQGQPLQQQPQQTSHNNFVV